MIYEALRDALRAEEPVALATMVEGPRPGAKLLVRPGQCPDERGAGEGSEGGSAREAAHGSQPPDLLRHAATQEGVGWQGAEKVGRRRDGVVMVTSFSVTLTHSYLTVKLNTA